MDNFDTVIIGGGLVGLSIARAFSNQGTVVLMEKDDSFLTGTSSRNSEVIHSGIYYEYSSLKRKLCISGKNLLYKLCEEKKIPFKKIGKLIISNTNDYSKIEELYERGVKNGLNDLKLIYGDEIKDFEPEIIAKAAIYSPSSGIIDSHKFGEVLANDAEINGALLLRKSQFISSSIANDKIKVTIKNPDETSFSFTTSRLINAAGHSALKIEKTLPFGFNVDNFEDFIVKGNYFSYSGKNPFKHLIYPMPDELGLGIHSTSNVANELKFGPDVDLDSIDFQVNENRKEFFASKIKQWWNGLDESKLSPSYVGLRPKIKIDDKVQKDFIIKSKTVSNSEYISLLGIESPGLTASLGIAEHIFNISDKCV